MIGGIVPAMKFNVRKYRRLVTGGWTGILSLAILIIGIALIVGVSISPDWRLGVVLISSVMPVVATIFFGWLVFRSREPAR